MISTISARDLISFAKKNIKSNENVIIYLSQMILDNRKEDVEDGIISRMPTLFEGLSLAVNCNCSLSETKRIYDSFILSIEEQR